MMITPLSGSLKEEKILTDTDIPKEWPEWTDSLGNVYRPGDIVAVATINGRSPQLVIARVEKINRLNSSGKEIITSQYTAYPEPVWTVNPVNGKEYWKQGEYATVPYCSVKATPLRDLRGFGRWSQKDDQGNHKAVTYSIPENIIKITTDREMLDSILKRANTRRFKF